MWKLVKNNNIYNKKDRKKILKKETRYMHRLLLKVIAAACATYSIWSVAHAEDDIIQKSAVLIQADCVDPKTGAVDEGRGSGVIVTKDGFLVTAFHVIDCWIKQEPQGKRDHPLKGRVASIFRDEKTLSVIRTDPQSDYAILKIEGIYDDWVPSEICKMKRPEAGGTSLLAVGFPKGEEYQPSLVQFGNSVGNFWSVSGALTFGMSGGGVYADGRLIGIVTSGDPKSNGAINKVSPIFRFAQELNTETGLNIQSCDLFTSILVAPEIPSEQSPNESNYFNRILKPDFGEGSPIEPNWLSADNESEWENNDPESAPTIMLLEGREGTLSGSDVDYFRLDLTGNYRQGFYLDLFVGYGRVVINVIDSSGGYIKSFSVSERGAKERFFLADSPPYYVEVRNDSGQTESSYEVWLR